MMGLRTTSMRIALHIALVVAASASGLNKEALPDEALLAREQLGAAPPVPLQKETIDAVFDDVGSLEALWEREAELAQQEAARFLQRSGGSLEPTKTPVTPPPTMPTTSPTNGPTPTPTSPPTSAVSTPTASPDFGTMAPTSAPSTSPTSSPSGTGTSRPSQMPTDGEESASPSTSPTGTGPATMAPTPSEDCLEGQPLQDYLVARLSSITDPELLVDPSTAQGMALQFLVNDPLIQTEVCTYPTVEQRYGLATFYYSTRGDSWTIRTAWLTDTNECLWYGVICVDDVRTTNLTLATNNLIGPLTDEISTLYMLDRLEMFGNQISSTIPSGISNLTKLCVFDVEQNSLTGPPFPESLLELTGLKQIFFSRNSFAGTLPTDIGNFQALQDLWIAENQVSGAIPEEIGLLGNMRTLILYDNKLDMAIPESIALMVNMTNLQLYDNDLEGSIPQGLYELPLLKVLLLDGNFLSGTIQPDIGLMTTLTDLRLHDNDFQGVVPEEILFLSNLRFFTVGGNFIAGPIPNVLTELTSLETADFADNFHTGFLPDTVFSLPAISRLYLQENNLTGPIPSFYSDPPEMVDLFLNDNSLTGTIPNIDPGEFSKLEELTFQFNDLTGSMPQAICDLRATGQLERLFVDCGGADPQIDCLFPVCCNLCFEGENDAADARRLERSEIDQESEGEQTQQLLLSRHTRASDDGLRQERGVAAESVEQRDLS